MKKQRAKQRLSYMRGWGAEKTLTKKKGLSLISILFCRPLSQTSHLELQYHIKCTLKKVYKEEFLLFAAGKTHQWRLCETSLY